MPAKRRITDGDLEADPFHELSRNVVARRRWPVLGGLFEFESDSPRLLQLVDAAYSGLPRHRLQQPTPRFHLRLALAPGRTFADAKGPPNMRMQGGANFLCGVMDSANFAVLSPADRRGLVVASQQLLRFPYHARYELLEFAVFVLGGRGQGLVPLHAACVGLKGRGLLLIGETGAGKSTVALQCLLQGLDFLTEDATFVQADRLLATGVSNFLHLREDSLRFIDRPRLAALVRRSPMIWRRSGVEKFEVDVRRTGCQLAPSPLEIAGVVFVSKRSAGRRAILAPLDSPEMLARLDRSQRYGALQPEWANFRQQLRRVAAFELRRATHPGDAAAALRSALD